MVQLPTDTDPGVEVWPFGQGSQNSAPKAAVTLDHVPALQSTHISLLLAP